jgi:hypothetical protein
MIKLIKPDLLLAVGRNLDATEPLSIIIFPGSILFLSTKIIENTILFTVIIENKI